MAQLTLVNGRKGPRDILVLVTANNQPLMLAEWLFIGQCYLDSEASYYPIEQGFLGEAMLIHALDELSRGADFGKVLKRYDLDGSSLNIIDNRTGRAMPWNLGRRRGRGVKSV